MIYIPGYTELEKLQIAEQYLLPKQKKEHGLEPEQIADARKQPDEAHS